MLPKQTQTSSQSGVAVVADHEASRKLVTARAFLRHLGKKEPSRETSAGDSLPHYRCVEEMITALRPNESVFCVRLAEFGRLAERFAASFPGKVLYAVKCNPHPEILRALHRAGIRDFDVASVAEIALIQELFGEDADIAFNNPAKSRAAIQTARRLHGVRRYVVDHASELAKLLEEVDDTELEVAVRLANSSNRARYDLSTKFGATPEEGVELLRAAHRAGLRPGLAFHVGSQCSAPEPFADALALCRQVTKTYGPTCDSDDVLGAPLLLPVDTDEGDWIEIGMMGAYSTALTTQFNGFSCGKFVSLDV